MRQNIDEKGEEDQNDTTNERPGFRNLSFLLKLVRDGVLRKLRDRASPV